MIQDKVTQWTRSHRTELEMVTRSINESKTAVLEHFKLFIIVSASYSRTTVSVSFVQRFENMHQKTFFKHSLKQEFLTTYFSPAFTNYSNFSALVANKGWIWKIIELQGSITIR